VKKDVVGMDRPAMEEAHKRVPVTLKTPAERVEELEERVAELEIKVTNTGETLDLRVAALENAYIGDLDIFKKMEERVAALETIREKGDMHCVGLVMELEERVAANHVEIGELLDRVAAIEELFGERIDRLERLTRNLPCNDHDERIAEIEYFDVNGLGERVAFLEKVCEQCILEYQGRGK
jgi:hypothetical protein